MPIGTLQPLSQKKNSLSSIRTKYNELVKECIKFKYLFLFLLPAIVWYVVFYYIPMYGVTIAFKDYSITKGILGSPWVGFEHFERMFDSSDFSRVLRNTLIISALKLTFVYTSGIFLALALNEIFHEKFKKIVQSLTYLPHFLSWVIIGSIMVELLSPSSGLVNQIIKAFGGNPIYFLAEEKWFVPILILSDVWQSCGWGSIIYLAAIAGIDTQLYEAATMDGAGRLQKIVHITLPSIANVIIIMMIFNIGNIMNAGFDQIFNLYNPRVYEVSDILDTYVYRVGLVQMNYSFSTAVGLFKNVIGLILVLLANRLANRFGQTGLW
ncbi:ABC transporter permease [Paenibacillus agricola]|uniref:Sugar ABC transporter permease n=1 Tax=Paenibacillus agricola TaxID=2716264 RepID=A0ABX0JJM5_9BACL|nr:ABC transporter permease subunit [Paenibacillus agricola]NHN34121.1 sugar ABC transporter permease [Paenibacillus agricola]